MVAKKRPVKKATAQTAAKKRPVKKITAKTVPLEQDKAKRQSAQKTVAAKITAKTGSRAQSTPKIKRAKTSAGTEVPCKSASKSDASGEISAKPTEAGYPAWLETHCGVELTPNIKNRYETVARELRVGFVQSAFWRQLMSALVDQDAAYYVRTSYRLLAPSDKPEPEVVTKPYESLVLKTYRRNVLNNDAWPNEIAEGWITPANWLTAVNDVVRTSIVVKYLDGVELVANLIDEVATSVGLVSEPSFEARPEGYYAAHVTVAIPLRVPSERWELQSIATHAEIQISTQVQDVIRGLTHKFYEARRRRDVPAMSRAWQWDFRSPEFVPNYLGHILHYVEGMIMEVRDRQELHVDE